MNKNPAPTTLQNLIDEIKEKIITKKINDKFKSDIQKLIEQPTK